MIWILIFIFLCYAFLITSLAMGFSKVKDFVPNNSEIINKFSVIIPFRNEAENLSLLLESILKLNYPTNFYEIILVDDESTDNSVAIIENLLITISETNIKVIQNKRKSNSPKKDAISTAIKQSKFNWIVTTDADCILPVNWLKTFDNFIQQKQPNIIVAPVSYEVNNTFLDRFQLLDFYSLQASTIGGFRIDKPFLCNGANLCYLKEDFQKHNGFAGNEKIASGDDIFLFEKFVKSDKRNVKFLKSKEVIVKTFPVKTWKELINQRIRWAAKTSNYQLWFGKFVGFIVFSTNLGLILATFLSFLDKISVINLTSFWIAKFFIDYMLIKNSAVFFNQKKPLKWYLTSSLLYPFFSVFVVLKSILTTYKWKDRTFKK